MNNIELRALRESLGLSQKAMGERLGIGWRMVAYIEAGEKPMSKASAMLAEKLTASETALKI